MVSSRADMKWHQDLCWNDAFRWQPSRARQPGYREWHHFCILDEQMDALVNFSIVDGNEHRPAVGQVMALVRHGRWQGGVERIPIEDVDIRVGRLQARFGESRLDCDGHYYVRVVLRQHGIAVDVRLRPVTEPFVAHNVDPAGGAPLSWLVVPRLVATGRVTAGTFTRSFEGAPAYHDHNWGRWGTEGVWDWGFGLSVGDDPECSVVFVRLSDRSRTEVRVQGLFLWDGASLRRVVRDGDLRFSELGSLVTDRLCKVPPVLRLLAPGNITGTPGQLEIAYADRGDCGVARFVSEQAAQVLAPEDDYPGLLVINEVSAAFELSGTLGGRQVRCQGRGIFEHVTA